MGYKITKPKFEKALAGSLGLVTTIAKKLGVERVSVYRYIERNPEYRDALDKERDKIIDRAESVLFEKVNDGDWKAVEFILNKLGSRRGYASKEILEGNIVSVSANDFSTAFKEFKNDKGNKGNNSKSND